MNWLGEIKKRFQVEEEGVVGNWNLITRLILNCAPYEHIKKVVEYINEYHFQKTRKLGIGSQHEKILTSPAIHKILMGKQEADAESKKLIGQLGEEDKEYILRYWSRKYIFIENWTRFSLFVSIFCSIIMFYFLRPECVWLIYGITMIGLLRVFEIMIRHIRIILFDTIGKNAVILRSPRRSIILLIYNILEMIFWFATSFMAVYLLSPDTGIMNFLSEKFRFGQFVMNSALQFLVYGDGCTSIGANVLSNQFLVNITFGEIVIGFIVTLVTFARLFSLLPNVTSQEEL